jgi:hypothetical protein
MVNYIQTTLWNANGLTQHTGELKTFISIHSVNHLRQNVVVTQTQVKTLHKQQTSHTYIKQYSNQSGLRNATLGNGFYLQHRKSRTLPIESFAHDSGHTLLCAEYGYLKGSPNTNS